MKINENKIKKLTLLAAILAPMVYLFGSLFAALQGAHGEEVFAQPEYVQEYVEVSDWHQTGEYKMVFDTDITPIMSGTFAEGYTTYAFDYTWSGGGLTQTSTSVRLGYYRSGQYNYFNLGGSREPYIYHVDTGVSDYRVPLPWLFYFEVGNDTFMTMFDGYYTLYRLMYVPSSTVVESPSAYSDYLFSQFFTRNNFLAASGEKVINGTPDYGFAPAADMIRYIDSNMLHLANVEWGALVIGYVYYAFHVTIVFLMFELLMFFPHMIENIYDKFERGL